MQAYSWMQHRRRDHLQVCAWERTRERHPLVQDYALMQHRHRDPLQAYAWERTKGRHLLVQAYAWKRRRGIRQVFGAKRVDVGLLVAKQKAVQAQGQKRTGVAFHRGQRS